LPEEIPLYPSLHDTCQTVVIALDAEAQQVRYWMNRELIGSASYTPVEPYPIPQFALAANRVLGNSVDMDFSAGFILHSVGPETRARGIDYLKREWGSRVTGW